MPAVTRVRSVPFADEPPNSRHNSLAVPGDALHLSPKRMRPGPGRPPALLTTSLPPPLPPTNTRGGGEAAPLRCSLVHADSEAVGRH